MLNIYCCLIMERMDVHMDWGLIISTTFTGLIVVFVILVILVYLVEIMGKIINKADKTVKPAIQTNNTDENEDESEAIINIESSQISDENDDEIIAVITAAITAYTENDKKRREKKKVAAKQEMRGRSAWANAGLHENTRSFY